MMHCGEKKLTTNGAITLTGAAAFEIDCDGEATFVVRDQSDVDWPRASGGDAFFTSMGTHKRKFAHPDLKTVTVTLVTATWAVVSWT